MLAGQRSNDERRTNLQHFKDGDVTQLIPSADPTRARNHRSALPIEALSQIVGLTTEERFKAQSGHRAVAVRGGIFAVRPFPPLRGEETGPGLRMGWDVV